MFNFLKNLFSNKSVKPVSERTPPVVPDIPKKNARPTYVPPVRSSMPTPRPVTASRTSVASPSPASRPVDNSSDDVITSVLLADMLTRSSPAPSQESTPEPTPSRHVPSESVNTDWTRGSDSGSSHHHSSSTFTSSSGSDYGSSSSRDSSSSFSSSSGSDYGSSSGSDSGGSSFSSD